MNVWLLMRLVIEQERIMHKLVLIQVKLCIPLPTIKDLSTCGQDELGAESGFSLLSQ